MTEEYLDVLGMWAIWKKQTMQVGLISLRELENLSSMKEDKAIMILHKEAWSWATKWATFMAINDLGRNEKKKDSLVTCSCESNIKTQHSEAYCLPEF